jgi:hypothetical protein
MCTYRRIMGKIVHSIQKLNYFTQRYGNNYVSLQPRINKQL